MFFFVLFQIFSKIFREFWKIIFFDEQIFFIEIKNQIKIISFVKLLIFLLDSNNNKNQKMDFECDNNQNIHHEEYENKVISNPYNMKFEYHQFVSYKN